MSKNENIMYTIDKITAVIEQYGDLPPTIFDKLVSTPVKALALLKNRNEWRQANQYDAEELAVLFEKLPSDISDPPDGVPVSKQGDFWLGYYQRKNLGDILRTLTPDLLKESGKILFGEHWQKPMAESLGLSDTARIRGWLASGKIPIGVWSEIDCMLRNKESRIGALLEATQKNK